MKGKEKDVKIAISTSFPLTNCGIPQLCLVLFDFKDISETVHFRQIMFIISSTKKCRFLCEFPSSLLLCMEVGWGGQWKGNSLFSQASFWPRAAAAAAALFIFQKAPLCPFPPILRFLSPLPIRRRNRQ